MMTPEHPDWAEFAEKLGDPDHCNFREVDGEFAWDCAGGSDKTYAESILKNMGLDEQGIQETFVYFDEHGGHCDCEILLNIDASMGIEEQEIEEEMEDGEGLVRAKWQMDGAQTLKEAAKMLRDFATNLEELENKGWQLTHAIEDDYGHIERDNTSNKHQKEPKQS